MPNDYGASHDFAKSKEKWEREHGQNTSSRPNVSEKNNKKGYGEPISFRPDKTTWMKKEYFKNVFKTIYNDENWDNDSKVLREIIDEYYEYHKSRLELIRKENEITKGIVAHTK